MLARFFHNLLRSPLHKRAVSSLEYAMIAMLVVVASVGAVNTMGAYAAPAAMQVASTK